jgi:ribosomal protein S14
MAEAAFVRYHDSNPQTEYYGKRRHRCDRCGKKLNVLRIHGEERICADCWVKATDPDFYNAMAELDKEFPGAEVDA